MKKGILLFVIVILLVGGVYAGYYAWDNSESTIRSRIKTTYYNELSNEECEGNNYRGFLSKKECYDAHDCISDDAANGVRIEDLKRFNKLVKSGNDLETEISEYLGNQFWNRCLTQHNFDRSRF